MLKGKKIAILLEKTYQDLEAWYPYYRLQEEGADVKFVAPKTDEEYIGKYGYPAKADLKIDDNKKVTSFFAIKDDLVNAGAKYVDEEVVRDGNLITSRKPDDLPAFVKAVIFGLTETFGPTFY